MAGRLDTWEPGNMRGSSKALRGSQKLGGLILAIPPPLVFLRTLKSLSFSNYKVKIWEDSALPKALLCSVILRFCGFRQAANNPLLSTYYVPGTRHYAQDHGL